MLEYNVLDVLYLAGAVAYLSTALVMKDGPFKVFARFRVFLDMVLGGKDNNPLRCTFCASFWLGIVLATLYEPHLGLQRVIAIFGLLGIANAIRGMSQIFD